MTLPAIDGVKTSIALLDDLAAFIGLLVRPLSTICCQKSLPSWTIGQAPEVKTQTPPHLTRLRNCPCVTLQTDQLAGCTDCRSVPHDSTPGFGIANGFLPSVVQILHFGDKGATAYALEHIGDDLHVVVEGTVGQPDPGGAGGNIFPLPAMQP